jgi:Alpha-L-arabinofuranosidase B (ABFB) domain
MTGNDDPYSRDVYFSGPLTPATNPGADLVAAGPEDRADQADEHTTRRPAAHPAAARPHRHARASRLTLAGLAARRRPFAVVAMLSVAAVAGIAFLVLPSNPRVMPMAECRPAGCNGAASTASSSAQPGTSLAGRAHRTMSMSASQAATPRAVSPAPTVSRTAKPTPTSVTSTPSPSPTPTSGNPGLSPGSVISIEATTACCTSFSVAHDGSDNRVVITQVTPDSSRAARADATWIVEKGLADNSCVSFKSADAPGEYLSHHDFELYLDPDDGSAQFARDATFCPRPGNSGNGYSFESYNDPSMFIRHFDYVVYIASDGGFTPWDTPVLWRHDTTWKVIRPWG